MTECTIEKIQTKSMSRTLPIILIWFLLKILKIHETKRKVIQNKVVLV